MLGALEAALRALRTVRVPHALIGATAMAGRGVLRATDDFDLLVTERAVLRPDFWKDLTAEGFGLEARVGDDADPLAGVVRLSRPPTDRSVDVVVGRFAWQEELILRAEPHRLGSVEVPLVLASDLILLKLFAASAQDILDARALLRAGDRLVLTAAVESHLGRLPGSARKDWSERVLGEAAPR